MDLDPGGERDVAVEAQFAFLKVRAVALGAEVVEEGPECGRGGGEGEG